MKLLVVKYAKFLTYYSILGYKNSPEKFAFRHF